MTSAEALKKLSEQIEQNEGLLQEDLNAPLSIDDLLNVDEDNRKNVKLPNVKSRVWVMLLYPDNEYHQEIIDKVYDDFVCVGALHDKDVNENGELKKEHYHIVFYFQSAVYASHLLNHYPQLGPRFLRARKDVKTQVRYLLHMDSPSKYQYPQSYLEGHLQRFSKYINSDILEADQFIAILDLMHTVPFSSLEEFLREICKEGLYSAYRRNSYTINLIFSESRKGD